MAPALMKLSIMRRFTAPRSTRSQKSYKRAERSAFGACALDRFDRRLAHVLDRAQTEADALRVAGGDRRKGECRGVDVRRQHLDAHLPAVVDVLDHLVGVAGFRGQQRAHELQRIVRFQIRDDVRQIRIRGRVGLVESVAGELGHLVEDLFDLALRDGPWPWRRRGSARAAWPSPPPFSCPWRGATDPLRPANTRPGDWRSASPVPDRRSRRRFLPGCPSARESRRPLPCGRACAR